MTANELANYLFDITDSETSPYHQAATMLIQQQTEIENLKRLTKEPTKLLVVDDVLRQAGYVKTKTLTDEEITDVYVECMLPYGEFDEHEFARAILRKAQEK